MDSMTILAKTWVLIIGLFVVVIGSSRYSEMDAVTIGATMTATATALLAIINWRYLQKVDLQLNQNNININITKNKILQESYLKEMDSIIGPLRSRIGHKDYEPLFLEDAKESIASEFWENIKKNKFLAPKELREIIDKYLITLDKQGKELQKLRYEIRNDMVSVGTIHEICEINEINRIIGPAPENEGYGTYIKNIVDKAANLGHETALSKRLSYFHDIAQEGYDYEFSYRNDYVIKSVKNARYDLEEAVEKRYNILEERIEDLRAEIEKDSTSVLEKSGN